MACNHTFRCPRLLPTESQLLCSPRLSLHGYISDGHLAAFISSSPAAATLLLPRSSSFVSRRRWFWRVPRSALASGFGGAVGSERRQGRKSMERPATTASPGSPHQISISSTVVTPPPTIFVQAEPHTFRDLVQKHTGAPAGDAPDKLPVTSPPPSSARSAVGPRRPAFKLQDRRPSVRKLEIKLGLASLDHHHHQQQQQPQQQQQQQQAYPSPRSPQPPSTPGQQYLLFARVGAPKASLTSPVTPLGSGPVFSPPGVSEEEKAIAEKGFYLHPSPRGTPPGVAPPELLTLFPLTSPRLSTSQSGGGGDDADGRIEKKQAYPR